MPKNVRQLSRGPIKRGPLYNVPNLRVVDLVLRHITLTDEFTCMLLTGEQCQPGNMKYVCLPHLPLEADTGNIKPGTARIPAPTHTPPHIGNIKPGTARIPAPTHTHTHTQAISSQVLHAYPHPHTHPHTSNINFTHWLILAAHAIMDTFGHIHELTSKTIAKFVPIRMQANCPNYPKSQTASMTFVQIRPFHITFRVLGSVHPEWLYFWSWFQNENLPQNTKYTCTSLWLSGSPVVPGHLKIVWATWSWLLVARLGYQEMWDFI